MLPDWTVAPFALFLLAIAILPLVAPHFWEKNRNKLILSLALGVPTALYLVLEHGATGTHWLIDSLKEYAAFIALLAALFVISGGIYVKGSLAGTPLVNTGVLAIGALVASVIGTTGASMLLIRPLLRANEKRARKVHLVIFFIFIVSNAGGMLTPLGDPPLFLGFLRGVDFLWTLRLWGPWLLVNAALLVVLFVVDQVALKREARGPSEVPPAMEPLSLQGGLNFLWLAGVVGINLAIGALGREHHWSDTVQKVLLVAGMALMAGLSMATTSREVRTANRFSWGPIVEVAAIFIGIFLTMVPALKVLENAGATGRLAIDRPWQFFWASGTLSSFLDNAPTYLTFATLGCGVVNKLDPTAGLNPMALGGMAAHPIGMLLLAAVSCGSVLMGANTYIGNGPNFMVKAIAEESGVKMPGFFGYMAWSVAILIPLFVVVSVVFFPGAAPAPAPAPAPAEPVLFDGKTLEGWTVPAYGGEGKVSVQGGSIIIDRGDSVGGIAWVGKAPVLPKTDYEISLEAKRVGGNDFFCGLTFPVGESHATFVVGGWGGGVVGISSLGGYDASENETSKYRDFDKDRWYTIRVRVTPAKIEAWIDEEQMVDVSIEKREVDVRIEMELYKPLGISTYATTAAIRNLTLRRLTP